MFALIKGTGREERDGEIILENCSAVIDARSGGWKFYRDDIFIYRSTGDNPKIVSAVLAAMLNGITDKKQLMQASFKYCGEI
jgi:hypothetical protein